VPITELYRWNEGLGRVRQIYEEAVGPLDGRLVVRRGSPVVFRADIRGRSKEGVRLTGQVFGLAAGGSARVMDVSYSPRERGDVFPWVGTMRVRIGETVRG
jgi:hypothetical protein